MTDDTKLNPTVLGRIRVEDYHHRSNTEEALKQAEKTGMRPVTVNEAYAIAKEAKSLASMLSSPLGYPLKKEFRGAFPTITSTHVKYEGTDCEITENGKTTRKQIPAESGWYKTDEFGLPFGAPSNVRDPSARYLIRDKKFDGYVAAGEGLDDHYKMRAVRLDGIIFNYVGLIAVQKEKQAAQDSTKRDAAKTARSPVLASVPRKTADLAAMQEPQKEQPKREKQTV